MAYCCNAAVGSTTGTGVRRAAPLHGVAHRTALSPRCCPSPLITSLHTLLPCCLQCDLLSEGIDVLIATPGRLTAHLEKGSLKLDNTAALVMDEVDVLAGQQLISSTVRLMISITSKPMSAGPVDISFHHCVLAGCMYASKSWLVY